MLVDDNVESQGALMKTLLKYYLLALFVGAGIGIALSGCESPEEITVPGYSCNTDQDCKEINPAWLCDSLTNKCYQPWGDVVFPKPEGGDEELLEQEDCKYCQSDLDCDAGMRCNLVVNCCIPEMSDGDLTDSESEKQSNAYISWDEELDFGSVILGYTVCQDLRIRNDGLDMLEIYSISYDNVNQTSEFFLQDLPPDITNGRTFLLAPSQQYTMKVCYHPVDMGIDTAELYIISNAYNAPIAKTLLVSQYKGTAMLCATIDPTYYDETRNVIDFMNVDIGDEPEYTWIQVWNCGQADGNKVLFLYDISLTGYDFSFSLDAPPASDTNPIILPPKGDLNPCPPPVSSLPSSCMVNADCKAPGAATNGLTCTADRVCDTSCDSNAYCQKGHPDWICENGVCKAPQSDCVTIGVHFAPYETGAHGEHLQIFNSSDDVEQQMYTIDLMGSAENSILNAVPSPLRCGSPCEYGSTMKTTTVLYNYSNSEVLIHRIDTVIPQSSDTPPWSFYIDPSTDYRDQPIPPSHNSGMEIDVVYEPDELTDRHDNVIPRDDLGLLRVRWCKTSNPDCVPCDENDTACERRLSSVLASSYFPIMCSGKPPNIPPIARIATMSHGPQVTAPIAMSCNEERPLFGDISRDDDSLSTLCAYCWHFRNKPDGSDPEIRSINYYEPETECPGHPDWHGWMNVVVVPDKSGEYDVELNVMDCDGAWNENQDNWVRLNVSCEKGIGIVLVYDGCDGKAAVDLMWKAPNGMTCSETRMNSNNTCDFRNYGAAIVSEYATQCQNGLREEIIHRNAQDGTYQACVKLVDECDHWSFNFFGERICFDNAHPSYTLYFYDPDVGAGHWMGQVSGHLGDQGQVDCYSLTRENGEWVEVPGAH